MASKAKKIDEIDLEILKILQVNSKTSYRDIQESLNISIGTIHNRINDLKHENGGPIEGYGVHLNNKLLGYDFMFLIQFEVEGYILDETLKELRSIPEICSILNTTGERSVTLICHFKSLDNSHLFIRELNKNAHVSNVVSNLVLNTYKNDPSVQIQ